MFKGRKSVFIIAGALIGLLFMQGMWVYYAISQENKFLNSSTRQAAIESINSIEQKEDSKLLITNLDTILNFPNEKSKQSKSKVKVIVSKNNSHIEVHDTENEQVTTSYYSNSSEGKNEAQVRIIQTTKQLSVNSPEQKRSKIKLKNYEQLLKKIVYQSQPKNLKIEERVNFNELKKSINKNLEVRGIDILPELAIKDGTGKFIFKTANYVTGDEMQLPMFTKDIVFQNYTLNIFYPSTLNYIIKKAIGIILLSLGVTSLLIIVILLLYKKTLTQQKLNQYKSDFINNLTHELKTPIATISLANANIASSAKFSGIEIQRYSKIIDEENKKLNTQIERVFELSLLEKEKQIIKTEIVDVHLAIKESISQNASVIKEKAATVNLPFHASIYNVKADKFHFINAISNLIDNSLKYTNGNVVIDIATKNAGNKMIISVKDNGMGIDKDQQKFIFDKFFRVTNKNIHTVKGFGIGLSYVKQIIELFNGTVEVKSENEKGAEFIITLPNAKA